MSLGLEAEKIQHPHGKYDDEDEYEDEKEEEALSLCDLPVSTGNKEEGEEEEENRTGEADDFDFGSLIGSISAIESEMCAADELFSGGQMLPFRHSVSSEVGLSGFQTPSRSVSRSESMDRSRFGSRSSSRSSSTRSHQSNASSSTSSSSCSSSHNLFLKTRGAPKPKVWNQFHSYPSPKPQVWASGARPSTCTTLSGGTKSTMSHFLRLGLVRAPEIELQDLKARNRSTNYNKTLKKCTNNETPVIGGKINDLLLEVQRRNNQFSNDKNSGGFFKSCKCSVGAIEPIPTRVRSNSSSTKMAFGGQNKFVPNQALNEEEYQEEMAKKKQGQQRQNRHKQQLRQGKQAMSHHRTFEWLIRDLSHASVLNS